MIVEMRDKASNVVAVVDTAALTEVDWLELARMGIESGLVVYTRNEEPCQ